MYSRKLQTLDFKNAEASLRALLRQINVIQEESEREITRLSKENEALKDRVKALEEVQ